MPAARQGQLLQLNRVLLWGVPLLAVLLGRDLFYWGKGLQRPVEPVPPGMADFRDSPTDVPTLNFPAALFSPAQPVLAQPGVSASAPKPEWKVKGILMGASPRAYLEGPEGKENVWVTEGQQVGPFKVQKIHERSVVLQAEGGASVEISL